MTSPQNLYTIPQVLPEIQKFFEETEAGCCLHTVLDDGNVRDSNVIWCINFAQELKHKECERIGRILFIMSRTQRKKIAGQVYGNFRHRCEASAD